jgi:peptidoglycan-associated lipoprotein
VPTLLLLALALGLPACKKKDLEVQPAPPVQQKPVPPPAPPPVPPKTEVREEFPTEPAIPSENIDDQIRKWNEQRVLRTVYFNYDSFELGAEAREVLRANADWLAGHRDVKVVIEGHCDERGTIEYNLALGEKRAHSVRAHLATLGVDASRVRLVTFGEERPADPGHGETAWAKNRRAQFVLER